MPGQAAQGGGFLGGLLVPFRPSEKEPVMRGGTRSYFLPPTGGNSRDSLAGRSAANPKPPAGRKII